MNGGIALAVNTESEYRRYSGVLREDIKTFAITPARRPRGKVIIEVNGNSGLLKCSVKNLLPLEAGDFEGYGVWLVNDDDERKIPIKTGSIKVSSEGVGESTWSFNAEDVKSVGLDIDSFTTVEVRVEKITKGIQDERVLVGQLELEEANLSEEPKMEKVSPFGAGMPQSQWWKFYPGFLNNSSNYPSINHYPAFQGAFSSEQGPGSYAGGNISGAMVPGCSDFGKFQTGPVFQGHQLVGLQYDQKGAVRFLIHGIPGRFCLRDQPYGGETGYVYWHPLPGQQYQAGDYGYWLVYIDPVTGEVVYPRTSTVPPNCDNCGRT